MAVVRPTRESAFNQSEIRAPANCAGKQKFDRATANRVVRETLKERLSSFECRHCGGWHVDIIRSGPPTTGRRPKPRVEDDQ